MGGIKYLDTKDLDFIKVLTLYENAGWTNYTSKPEVLRQAMKNSLYILTAWEGSQLVGLLRAVGDGLTIIYIQDILVMKNFRRQGIGKQLIAKTLEEFKHVRQVLLLTDDNQDVISFYESSGFKQTKDLKLTSFIRISS